MSRPRTRHGQGRRVCSKCWPALSLAVWLVVLQPWHYSMGDLAVYRAGSLAIRNGQDLYLVTGGADHLHFTYPPFAAVALAPLTFLPWSLSKLVVTLLTAAALVGCVRLALNRVVAEHGASISRSMPIVLAVVIWLEPIRSTVSFGQINMLLMALVLADLLWLRDDRRQGWLIGIAAAIKLTPLAFVVYLVACRRWRATVNAVAGFVAAAAVGFVAQPHASREYWGGARFLEARRVGRIENASNQSVRGILARLLHTTAVPAWWLVAAAAIFVVLLVLAVQLHRDGHEIRAIAVMAVAMLCASPISWSHHWVWCVLISIGSVEIAIASRRRLDVAIAVAIMLPFALGLVFWTPYGDGRELTDNGLQQLLAASYVFAGLGFGAWMAVVRRRGTAMMPTWPATMISAEPPPTVPAPLIVG